MKYSTLCGNTALRIHTRMQLLILQAGKCAICEIKFGLYVPSILDHDHRTDEVRGLLCQFCNVSLGRMEMGLKSFAKKHLAYIQSFQNETPKEIEKSS